MIQEKLTDLIKGALKNLDIEARGILLEHPADLAHGDYSTNVALVYAKELKMKPREVAEKIVAEIKNKGETPPWRGFAFLERTEIAGAGFINFYLSSRFFADSLAGIFAQGENFSKNQTLAGKKVMVEYTNPNPFKEFHIGHLMSNAVGESIARLIEFSGAKVVRACWQGDVGLHVAKAIWGVLKNNFQFSIFNFQNDAVALLGQAYVMGSAAYEKDPEAKIEIDDLNKKIFEKSDPEVNKLYEEGREGEKIVAEFLKKGVFEKSENAVIFRGEKFGLHTRVFITSQGLPTYEAKELGLNRAKFEKKPNKLASAQLSIPF